MATTIYQETASQPASVFTGNLLMGFLTYCPPKSPRASIETHGIEDQ